MITTNLYSGLLSDYFETVAFKILSKVDTALGSNQREFNGVSALKELFGLCINTEKKQVKATFIYLDEDESQNIIQDGFLTWYNARAKSFFKTNRIEYHLYYQANDITKQMKEGDFLAIAKKKEFFHVIIARHNTTAEKQIMWLFGVKKVENNNTFQIKKIENNSPQINLASRFILDILNIEIRDTNKNYVDLLYEKFGDKIPNTLELSQFTLETIRKEIDPIEEPDAAIIKLFSQEEIFYKTLEKIRIENKLKNGFVQNNYVNVEEFLQFSLSIQNARKSRAGRALENHLSFVLDSNKILYTHGGITENKSKPDFIFPSITKYHDSNFPSFGLSMLASKSTCKDRWRQVLSESVKIKQKHLFTLEPSISEHQTNEMRANNLILVLPSEIKSTYTTNQQKEIMSLKDFLLLVKRKQESFLRIINI